MEFVHPGWTDNVAALKSCSATKTTVNDGVRSLFTQFPDGCQKYILTAMGSEVFGKGGSVEKPEFGGYAKEGSEHGIMFVAVNGDNAGSKNIISYSKFIEIMSDLTE